MHSKITFVSTGNDYRVSCRLLFEHIAAAVIVIHAHCCLAAADHCYVMLGAIKVVDKSVNDHSARRLDHCHVISFSHSQQLIWDQFYHDVDEIFLTSAYEIAQIGSCDRSRIHVPDLGGTGV